MIPKPFPVARHALVVVAHPDDESFGLGAVLDVLVRGGAEVSVLCFTHGEASTLHGGETGDLFQVRQAELAAAANALGVGHTRLLSYPDGSLSSVALSELVARVRAVTAELRPSCLVARRGRRDRSPRSRARHDSRGHATRPAGVRVDHPRRRRPRTQRAEFGTAFTGRPVEEIDWTVSVDRGRQWRAIAAHVSQSADNPVLRERLRLLGDTEHVLILRPGPAAMGQGPHSAGRSAVAISEGAADSGDTGRTRWSR